MEHNENNEILEDFEQDDSTISPNIRKTDDIFKKYNSGESTMEEVNKELVGIGAGFHLEPLTDEERMTKRIKEDEEGYIPNPNPKPVLPKNVDMRRRLDLIGAPVEMREIKQVTRHGVFLVHYDEQGYAVRSTRIS